MKRTLLGLVSIAALAACQPAEAPKPEAKTDVAVTVAAVIKAASAEFKDGSYTLSWSFAGEASPVTISVASDPSATEGDVIASDVTATNFSWTPTDGVKERHYFIVTPKNGEGELFATRLLPLEGGRNFRELGGYETADGKSIKWGKLYRSGVMNGLTEADYNYLSSLDIKVICDFRTAEERSREPTEWQAGEVNYKFWPDPEGDFSTGFAAVFRDPELTPEKVKTAFGKSYFGMAHQQAPAYAFMFDQLAAGNAPLAFNCSAGKDRTGVGAALLLTVLGVPRDMIVHDYQLSDDYVDYMAVFANEDARKKAEEENSSYSFFFKLPKEIIEPIMATYPEYIETFFSDIEAEYGDVMTFLKEKVELTDEEIAAIRSQYLED